VIYRKKGLKKVVNKLLYKNCDYIVTVSNEVKKVILEDFLVNKDKVITIYDAIEVKSFSEEEKKVIRGNIRNNYGIEEDTFLLLNISRIEKIKGHNLILESVKELVEKNVKIKILFLGKVEDKIFFNKLERYVLENKLEENVIFIGFKDNVDEYIISSDIIVSASYFESMGKNILEGIYYNKPFVTTKVGGLKELVNEDYGIFVEVGKSEEVTDGIYKVINNYNYYVENIKKLDKKIFTPTQMVNKYEMLYKLLSKETK
jgi:glycosyltransferase involved in cell wall biosynthesis